MTGFVKLGDSKDVITMGVKLLGWEANVARIVT